MEKCKYRKPRTPENYVKGFSQALSHYGWITLKEVYVIHRLTFSSLVEAEIHLARTAQYPLPFLRL